MAGKSVMVVEMATAFNSEEGMVHGKLSERSGSSEDFLNNLRIAEARLSAERLGHTLKPCTTVEPRQCLCGAMIPEKRLRALPNVRTCVSCQSSRDDRR